MYADLEDAMMFVVNVMEFVGYGQASWNRVYVSPHDSCLCYAVIRDVLTLREARLKLEGNGYIVTEHDYVFPMILSISKGVSNESR